MKISKKVKMLAVAGVFALAGLGVALMPREVMAANTNLSLNNAMVTINNTNQFGTADLPTTISNIVKIFMYAVGVISVIMMIFGGFQYVTSSGDQAKVTKAKNTILYGIVGLVIAVLAYAIVSFVIGQSGR